MVVTRRGGRNFDVSEAGFTYLWVLIAMAVVGTGLLAASEVWTTSARQQQRVELEWIGTQFTRAIGSYYHATPGAAKAYPQALEDLLEDQRYPTVRRHLRTVYANPFTGKTDWEMLRGADGRVRGVRAVMTRAAQGGPGEVREFVYLPLAPQQ